MPTEDIDLSPTPQLIPPWTGGGDRDFHGHGLRVNLFTELDVRNDNELWLASGCEPAKPSPIGPRPADRRIS